MNNRSSTHRSSVHADLPPEPVVSDWFERPASGSFDRPVARSSERIEPERPAPQTSDPVGHELFTHVAVPTQRVDGSVWNATPGSATQDSVQPHQVAGRTERIPARRIVCGATEQQASAEPPRGSSDRASAGRSASVPTGPSAPIGRVSAGRSPSIGRVAPGPSAQPQRAKAGPARHSSPRSQRAALGSIVAGAALAAAVALLSAGFAGSLLSGGPTDAVPPPAAAAQSGPAAQPGPTPQADPAAQQQPAAAKPTASPPAATPRMIMVIRHGEKPGDTPGAGVDPSGKPDDHSLTPRGWSRAKSLSRLFAPTDGAAKPGIAQPKVIYAASPTGAGTGQRTRETVMPLSIRLHVPVNTAYGKGQEAALVRSAVAQSQKGPVLISWQHGEIPTIASAMKVVGPQPPKSWPDSRYDMVWTFTQTPQGTWTFSQTPQMLLAGDSGSTFR